MNLFLEIDIQCVVKSNCLVISADIVIHTLELKRNFTHTFAVHIPRPAELHFIWISKYWAKLCDLERTGQVSGA